MPDALSPEEQAAAERTAAEIEALRSESRRRLAAEQREVQAKQRRRDNVIKAYKKKTASV